MSAAKKTSKTCSRGHIFAKSRTCPVCPKCWPGFYKEHGSRDFDGLSAPAQRALFHANIRSVKALSGYSEKEILALHGMGPASLPSLRTILKKEEMSFKKQKSKASKRN